MTDPFKDIRPYYDHEVSAVLARLVQDKECLSMLRRIAFPKLQQHLPALAQFIVKQTLKAQTRKINSVADFQNGVITKYLEKFIDSGINELSISGVDKLDANKAYLFFSNHRDIALDPALLNYTLNQKGHDTFRIGIGDNLLSKPFISDIMRLNKSYIVKRNISRPRELLKNLKQLSQYIHFSICEEDHSVWLAQREGRAKDGIDLTEPAVLKMLAMSGAKQDGVAKALNQLNMVPVTISYEYDPCDVLKAKELTLLEKNGEYQKAEDEDEQSISLGIRGFKGDVHISIGQPLRFVSDDVAQIAKTIDEKIVRAYVLHPSNFIAYHMLYNEVPDLACGADQQEFKLKDYQSALNFFSDRIKSCPKEYQQKFLQGYANAVEHKLKYQ